MHTTGNQTSKMRHINHQKSTDFIGDFTEPFEINLARNGRTTCNDQGRLVFNSKGFDLIVIKGQVIFTYTVLDGIEPFP